MEEGFRIGLPMQWRTPTPEECAVVQRMIDEHGEGIYIGERSTDFSQLSTELACCRVREEPGWLDFDIPEVKPDDLILSFRISGARAFDDTGMPIDFVLTGSIDQYMKAHLRVMEIIPYGQHGLRRWPDPSELKFGY